MASFEEWNFDPVVGDVAPAWLIRSLGKTTPLEVTRVVTALIEKGTRLHCELDDAQRPVRVSEYGGHWVEVDPVDPRGFFKALARLYEQIDARPNN